MTDHDDRAEPPERPRGPGPTWPMVTVNEAAKLAQVSHRTIRRLIASKKLPAYRFAEMRVLRISLDDLRGLYAPAVDSTGEQG